nr:NUDIX domain-containing protein [Marinicella rhabdoformis]
MAWIYIKNNQFLSARSKGKDTYYIPGGKREADESDHQALTREIKEELTVDLTPESIKYLGTFVAQAHGMPEGLQVKMTCYEADYSGEVKADSEIEEVVWFNHKDKHKSSLVDQIIID